MNKKNAPLNEKSMSYNDPKTLYHIKWLLEQFLQSMKYKSLEEFAEPFYSFGKRVGFSAILNNCRIFIKPAKPRNHFRFYNGYGSDIQAIQSLVQLNTVYYAVFACNENDNPYMLPPRTIFLSLISNFAEYGKTYSCENLQLILSLKYFVRFDVHSSEEIICLQS